MRKRILNIIYACLSLGFALTLFFIFVFSTLNTNTSITNTFYFDVDQNDFFVNISGIVSNYGGDKEIPEYKHDYLNASEENFVKWEVPDLVFDSDDGVTKDIIFTFVIENYNTDKKISVEVIDYESVPPSTRIKNTPSAKITLNPLRYDINNNPMVDSGTIIVNVSVIDEGTTFSELNSFRLKFDIV